MMSNAGARHMIKRSPDVRWHVDFQMSTTPGLKRYATATSLANQQDMSSSTIASFGYPYSLNTVLAVCTDSANISLAYYSNVPVARIGTLSTHVVITPLLVLFVLLGGALSNWRGFVAWYLMLDLLLFFPKQTPLDVASKMGALAIGYVLQSV